jgi:hypothetical protein
MEGGAGMTVTGALIGTPAYMPPEQAAAEGAALSPASDCYSLGAILYELLTGSPPFRGAGPVAIARMVVEEQPARPRSLDANIGRDLEAVCLRCLEKDPALRYQSAADLAADLGRFLHGEAVQARRVPRWWGRWPVAAAALVLAAILWTTVRIGPPAPHLAVNRSGDHVNGIAEAPVAPPAATGTGAAVRPGAEARAGGAVRTEGAAKPDAAAKPGAASGTGRAIRTEGATKPDAAAKLGAASGTGATIRTERAAQPKALVAPPAAAKPGAATGTGAAVRPGAVAGTDAAIRTEGAAKPDAAASKAARPEPPRPAGLSVDPGQGSGSRQVFTFRYSEPEGTAIAAVEVEFLDANSEGSCRVFVRPDAERVELQFDPAKGPGLRLGGKPGALDVLENAVCTVDLSAVVYTRREHTLEVRLPMTFKPPFGGPKDIHSWPLDARTGVRLASSIRGAWSVL